MVGNVLATTFRIWIRNLPRFLLVTAIAFVPIVGWNFLLAIDEVGQFFNKHFYQPFVELHPALRFDIPSGSWIPFALLTGAIAPCVVAILRDERISIWRGVAIAFRRAPWLIAIALIVRMSTTWVLTLVQIALWDGDRFYLSRTTFEWIGYTLLWVALASILLTAMPVAVTERRGVFSSLARAWRLARGERIKVFAVVFVHHALMVAIYYGLYMVMIGWQPTDDFRERFEIYGYVRLGAELVLASLYVVLAAVLFERLRASKEGPAETQLQRVFD